jgi:hypothetical protein
MLRAEYYFGFQAILERGVLTYFSTRADAATGFKRKDFKYLDRANILPLECDSSTFVVHFSDGAVHRLSVVNYGETTGQISRQVCLLFQFQINSQDFEVMLPSACSFIVDVSLSYV